MRALPLIVLLALLPAVVLAAPTGYVIQFSVDPADVTQFGVVPTFGSFVFDPANTISPFSSFLVVWNGTQFDLTTRANINGTPVFGCGSQTAAPQLGTNIMFQSFVSPCTNLTYFWTGDFFNVNGGTIEQFGFSVSNPSCNCSTGFGQIITIDPSSAGPGAQGRFAVSAAPEPATLIHGVVGVLLIGALPFRLRRRA